MSKKVGKRYTFSLIGVNINKVEKKYGVASSSIQEEEIIPENTTKIDNLHIIKKTPDVVSFLDESKRLRKCAISIIDFQKENTQYNCFWCKHPIPESVYPVGCPLRYIPYRAIKSYKSEINKEQYTISEPISQTRGKKIQINGKVTIEKKGYYETDCVFCSFNCGMAFVQDPENKRNPLYRNSESLLLQMYNDLRPTEQVEEIVPAPHWRTLSCFGGHFSIEAFRDTFNKISYTEHGIVCASIGRIYEDQIKF